MVIKFPNNLSAFCNSGGLKNTKLQHLSLALYSGLVLYFQPITLILESTCSYWLLYALLLSDKWRCYELIGCWKKWLSLYSKIGLWQQWCRQVTLQRLDSSWDGTFYVTPTFPATVLSWRESLGAARLKTESDNKQNKMRARAKMEQGGCSGVASQYHATASLISKCCPTQL